jgi:dehydrogenase/reductase SDR family member 7
LRFLRVCQPVAQYTTVLAGSSQSAAAEETSHVVGQEVLRLNAEGVIAVGRALLRQMLERQMGRLVVIASMAAKIPSPGQAEYSAAKHALIGYFLSVAAELADRCVGVTVVCPGPIGGEKSRSVFGPSGRIVKSESEKDQNKKVPMARCCQLICDAAAHQVAEAWIAKHPVLGLAYLVQWLPGAATAVLARVGPKRARALSEGRSGYEYDLARKEE